MHVTYNGPHDAVEIPDLTAVTVERGGTIQVDDDFGARLIEQATWDAPPDEVLGWVGKDLDRAAAMLRAERDGSQRAEVLEPLDKLLNPPPKPTKPAKPGTDETAGKEG